MEETIFEIRMKRRDQILLLIGFQESFLASAQSRRLTPEETAGALTPLTGRHGTGCRSGSIKIVSNLLQLNE